MSSPRLVIRDHSAKPNPRSMYRYPIKVPEKPFAFMTKSNLERAWSDFQKRIGVNVREIEKGEQQAKEEEGLYSFPRLFWCFVSFSNIS